MNEPLKLLPSDCEQPVEFMTPDEYDAFSEWFQETLKPDLDRQREARLRSEEDAKRHLIG